MDIVRTLNIAPSSQKSEMQSYSRHQSSCRGCWPRSYGEVLEAHSMSPCPKCRPRFEYEVARKFALRARIAANTDATTRTSAPEATRCLKPVFKIRSPHKCRLSKQWGGGVHSQGECCNSGRSRHATSASPKKRASGTSVCSDPSLERHVRASSRSSAVLHFGSDNTTTKDD